MVGDVDARFTKNCYKRRNIWQSVLGAQKMKKRQFVENTLEQFGSLKLIQLPLLLNKTLLMHQTKSAFALWGPNFQLFLVKIRNTAVLWVGIWFPVKHIPIFSSLFV